jgi:hypothetical protein
VVTVRSEIDTEINLADIFDAITDLRLEVLGIGLKEVFSGIEVVVACVDASLDPDGG